MPIIINNLTNISVTCTYYLDIEKILSESSSSWNWNGNTLEVYETDINNTLQRETVEGLNMESSVDCVSTRGKHNNLKICFNSNIVKI